MKHWNSKSSRSKNVNATFRHIGIDCTRKQPHMMIGCNIEIKSDHLKKTDLVRLRKLIDEVIKNSY